MSAHLRRMAARLWPDSLFRRLAIILFAGLLAAHLLSFGLVALNVFGPSVEQSEDYFMRSVATEVAIPAAAECRSWKRAISARLPARRDRSRPRSFPISTRATTLSPWCRPVR